LLAPGSVHSATSSILMYVCHSRMNCCLVGELLLLCMLVLLVSDACNQAAYAPPNTLYVLL
jgi:hypothetical protein